ncbi:imidazole glycerol phosphate synthase subunit HisH [Salmonella enterica subsp. enterica]|uniref:Imidazole glycerol phosphate synthase subunit HisH n=1 Tax=Salmonella enterica I TaxID=59201 RepID=A0A379URT1_SALET|nr:imidazole glycerol phosphate synthase subunit HisH [Salmonella enterica subsp. enterica]
MNVVILDTGCANLSSVKSAVARHGYTPVVSREAEIVLRADKLFLPGVGTAQAAMDQLRERELIDLIKACTQPVLGICLGMQLLGRRSEETRGVDLLNIIEQDVPKMTDFGLPLPHMAGIACIRRRATGCFRALKMAPIFTLFTATRCRSTRGLSPSAITASRLPRRYRKIISSAYSSIRNVRARRAHSC